MAETRKILFVCLGNIVRSPLAENYFRNLVVEAGLEDKYQVDSAGTAAYHIGDTPDARMRQVAEKRGLKYSGSGRQFVAKDFEKFDLIIPMDLNNLADLKSQASGESQIVKLRLMREFDPQMESDNSVPDPYYGGTEGFENVYDIIERSSKELFRQLESGELKVS